MEVVDMIKFCIEISKGRKNPFLVYLLEMALEVAVESALSRNEKSPAAEAAGPAT